MLCTVHLESYSLTLALFIDFVTSHLKIDVENESLEKLASELPGYIAFCREESTLKKYQSSFKLWVSWSKSFKVRSIPAESSSVALFILSGIQSGWSVAKIEGAFYGIRFFHLLGEYPNPCKQILVVEMREAAKRLAFKHKNRKQPITRDHLKLLHAKLSKVKNIHNLRTMSICLLGYAGFMRYSEIAGLRRCDIYLYDSYMKLFIEKSKN